jgi:hypothetical protein
MNIIVMRNLFWLSILVTLCSGCEDKGVVTPPQASQQGIMPLKVGNCWIYETTFLDTLGNVILVAPETLAVVVDTMIKGETWFRVKNVLYTNRSSGLWIWGTDEPYLFYKYPTEVGDSTLTGYGTIQTVTATARQVNVPAGTFSCVEYSQRFGSIIGYVEYCSYNVGVIRYDEFCDKYDGNRIYHHCKQSLLISYQLN